MGVVLLLLFKINFECRLRQRVGQSKSGGLARLSLLRMHMSMATRFKGYDMVGSNHSIRVTCWTA